HPVGPAEPTANPAAPAAASTPAAASSASPAGRAELTTAPGGAGASGRSGGSGPDHPAAAVPSQHRDPAGHGRDAHRTGTPPPATPPPESGSVLGYPGDQATPQQLAAWMGARAQQAGLPPELPVMAALTESGLRNLSYGDRDSVGFFQMRLGIWDEGAYAGYPDHPDLQIQWFIDHAVAARAQDPALAQSPTTWGEWVADVEQPAAEYRYRYQLQFSTAQEQLRGADLAPTAGSVAPVPVGQTALNEAMHLLGHGAQAGARLEAGPDSASLIQFAYARQGIQLPPAAAEQLDVGIPVAKEHLRPGDAVFFAQAGGYVHHVGLYVGHGRFASAADGRGEVKVSSLSDPRFAHEYVGARRYTAAAVSNPASYARPLPTVKP
ncbi:MAG TPA: NlpC/P60 family protein, partial [Trebonia sp.]